MTARDCLKMIREGVIDCRPARDADQRNALGHEFLRDNHAKMSADLRHQADKRRRGLARGSTAGEIACRFGYRLRQNGAKREIACFQGSAVAKMRVRNIVVQKPDVPVRTMLIGFLAMPA
jgi:hypothetical protein